MHDKIIALYKNGHLTNVGLTRAITYGWITTTDYEKLTGEPFNATEVAL